MALANPTTSSIQQPPPSSRKDTVLLKRKLAESIPDTTTEKAYWSLLSQFLLGRIAKAELDTQLKDLLSQDAATIHNQLLLAILHNAQKDIPAPSTTVSKDPSITSSTATDLHLSNTKRKAEEILAKDALKKTQASRLVSSLNNEDRCRLKALNDQHSLSAKRMMNHHPLTWVAPEMEILLRPPEPKDPIPTCVDEFDLPSLDTLQTRMDFHAKQYGLAQGVSAQGVEYLSMALDNFIKDIIARTVSKVRPTRTSLNSQIFVSKEVTTPPPLQTVSDTSSITSSSLEGQSMRSSPLNGVGSKKKSIIQKRESRSSTPTPLPSVPHKPLPPNSSIQNHQWQQKSSSRSKPPRPALSMPSSGSITHSTSIPLPNRNLNEPHFIAPSSSILYDRPKHVSLLDISFATAIELSMMAQTRRALEIRENINAHLEDFEDDDELNVGSSSSSSSSSTSTSSSSLVCSNAKMKVTDMDVDSQRFTS
ncbi:hypothetical protein SeMB42_g01980 [Synchytrium endobioticum]|uniref:Transcriptional coactivator HFI1/ADA1 n=1 Tax=Synchytrium endobioticum TaxID=286115 RepID=A0A507DI14_9FUNG|nr:hypothetical protein SeLEV6574_g00440 [Synchytrium endobioticum]TPX51300.1 hypothetical protein SeMB42_g01980 [Synchytrium endobioticum]